MRSKIFAFFLVGAFMFSLYGGEISQKKIKSITQIVRWEFNKVISPGRPARKWQIYKSVSDPRIKRNVYAAVRKKVTPFETRAKQVGLSSKVRAGVYKKVALRFPYKNQGDIAKGALKEAEREYPLVKKGDDVTIRYYRNGIFSKISGKIQSVRDDGRVYEINNQLIKVSEIQKGDRKYFDPDVNEALRRKFITYYQDNFAKIKREYTSYLMAEELEKMTVNEKNGYIFFNDRWVTAKYVTDNLYSYYLRVTQRRLRVEKEHFVRQAPRPAKKKK